MDAGMAKKAAKKSAKNAAVKTAPKKPAPKKGVELSQAALKKRVSESIFFASLEKFASKRYVRSDLVAGDNHKVSAEIVAKIGRAKLQVDFAGELAIGHPTETSQSVAAAPADIVAALLSELDASTRVKLLDRLKREYLAAGELVVSKASRDEAQTWLTTLRTLKGKIRAGTISFNGG